LKRFVHNFSSEKNIDNTGEGDEGIRLKDACGVLLMPKAHHKRGLEEYISSK